MSTPTIESRTTLSPALREALAFEAPYVIEKLLKNHTADDEHDAELLFREAKRYLALAHTDRTSAWSMYSLRVDEAWHQFVLFTVQYAAFCQRYFGRFVHHAPSNAPKPTLEKQVLRPTFAEFTDRYRALFGCDLPQVWHDESTVTDDRRLINRFAGELTVSRRGGDVELVRDDGAVVFSVNQLGEQALRFVARTGAFYVRELPGDLTGEERNGLAATLVSGKILQPGA